MRYAESTILSPAEHLVFLDWRAYAVKWNVNTCTCCSGAGAWGYRWDPTTVVAPHNGQVNCAFLDGHAKSLSSETLNAAMRAGTKPWNNQ